MKYLLDTNIVIAASLALNEHLHQRMADCDDGDLATPAIVYAEALFGSMRDRAPPIGRLQLFIEEVPVLDFDNAAAAAYASLPFKRGGYDRLVGAHAVALGLTLVTANEADFADIPGLKIENWTLPL